MHPRCEPEIGSLHLSDPAKAVTWFARAIDWFEDSKVSEFVACRQPPVEWLLDLADSYVELGRWRNAADEYEKVLDRDVSPLLVPWNTSTIELRPEAAEPAPRARALAGRAAVALQEGDLERACRDCAEAIALQPGDPSPYATEAEILSKRGQHEEAVTRWRTFARLAPSQAARADAGIGDELRSQAFEERDDQRRGALFNEAIAAYRRALRTGGPLVRSPFGRAYLGRCLAEVGEPEQAMPQLEEAAKTAGSDAQYLAVHHELALAYEKAGYFPQAEDSYRQAKDIAMRALDDPSKLPPGGAVGEASYACNLLAWFLVEHEIRLDDAEREATQAVQLADEALRVDPSAGRREDLANVRDTLGWIRHRRGCHAAAIKDLHAAVQLSPQSSFRAHLAIALEARADGQHDAQRLESYKAAARDQWRRIRELDPDSDLAVIATEHLHDAARPLADPPAAS